MKRAKVGTITVALSFIALGAALLLDQFGLWHWDFLKYVGPFVLIALGLEIIVMRAFSAGEVIRYSVLSFVVAALAVLVSVGYSGVTVIAPGFIGPAQIVPVSGELPVDAQVARVEVDLPLGRVTVTGGSSGAVRYSGNLLVAGRAFDQAQAEQTLQWTAERQGDTLVLRQARVPGWRGNAGFGWSPGRPYLNVEVPDGLEIYVHTRNSVVEAHGLSVEQLTLRTSNARVRAEDVAGPVFVTTTNGNVNLMQIGGAAVVTTTNGSVTLGQIDGAVDVTTSNGSVRLTDIGGPADVSTSNSSITATSAVLGNWRLTTTNSSITMNVPADTDAAVEAHTTNSKLGGTVPWQTSGRGTTGSATLGAGTHRVTLDTSNASIRVNAGH